MLGSTTNCQHLTVIVVLYRVGEVIAMTSEVSEGRVDSAGRAGIENLTLWQRVHEHLREEILDDRLPPGSELNEVALSQSLGVCRGPMREAIGRLASEGLVTVRPRRGASSGALRPGVPRGLPGARGARDAWRSGSPCRVSAADELRRAAGARSTRWSCSPTAATSDGVLPRQRRLPRHLRRGVRQRDAAGDL